MRFYIIIGMLVILFLMILTMDAFIQLGEVQKVDGTLFSGNILELVPISGVLRFGAAIMMMKHLVYMSGARVFIQLVIHILKDRESVRD